MKIRHLQVKGKHLFIQGNTTETLPTGGEDKSARIRGVLFDFDGTLTVPGAINFRAIKRDLGCPSEHPILEYIEMQPVERRVLLREILEVHEEAAARAAVPNRGVKACLSNLERMKVPFGIVTRNSLRSIQTALSRFQGFSMADFAVVITRDNSLPKPHPDGVIKAACAMGFASAELLVVGDFRFDVMAGKSAGARTALLTNGGNTTMEKGDPEPDFVCIHLPEVVDILLSYLENTGG